MAPLNSRTVQPAHLGLAKQFTRGFAAFLPAVAVYYFVFWVGGALITAIGLPFWVARLAGLVAALVAGAFVWRLSDSLPLGLAGSVAAGSLLLGSIGFVGGFVGPIVFMPEANQGPLLGIFITGPLGFLLGAVGGGIYWALRRKKRRVAAGGSG